MDSSHRCVFDEKKFTMARNREMIWSSHCLGVNPGLFHWCQNVKDQYFTFENGLNLITRFESKFPGALHMSISYGIEETCKNDYLPFVHAAQQAYKIYKPESGLYAIGYHSVATTFDKHYIKPRSKYHFAGE